MRRRRDDRGSITPLFPFLALALLLLGGLVVDASRELNARGRAVAYAEEAARAGAAAVRPGELVLDEDAAAQRVQDYCAALAADEDQRTGLAGGGCAFDGVEPVSDDDPRRLVVRTRVSLEIPASLLQIVGVRTLHASATARAEAFEGVTPADVDTTPPPVVVLPPAQPDPVGVQLPPPTTPPPTTPPPTPPPVTTPPVTPPTTPPSSTPPSTPPVEQP